MKGKNPTGGDLAMVTSEKKGQTIVEDMQLEEHSLKELEDSGEQVPDMWMAEASARADAVEEEEARKRGKEEMRTRSTRTDGRLSKQKTRECR